MAVIVNRHIPTATARYVEEDFSKFIGGICHQLSKYKAAHEAANCHIQVTMALAKRNG